MFGAVSNKRDHGGGPPARNHDRHPYGSNSRRPPPPTNGRARSWTARQSRRSRRRLIDKTRSGPSTTLVTIGTDDIPVGAGVRMLDLQPARRCTVRRATRDLLRRPLQPPGARGRPRRHRGASASTPATSWATSSAMRPGPTRCSSDSGRGVPDRHGQLRRRHRLRPRRVRLRLHQPDREGAGRRGLRLDQGAHERRQQGAGCERSRPRSGSRPTACASCWSTAARGGSTSTSTRTSPTRRSRASPPARMPT